MLSEERNGLLTRVGPGTAMGDLLRLYWVPILPGADLSSGAKPTRIRVLGEDLVAYRSPAGDVGVSGAHCPHRSAPMAYARNEDCGLRCVYHGWAFDSSGACIDMPNESRASRLKDSVSLRTYPCAERNGVVWLYMGADEMPPPLPPMEWNMVPESQVHLSFRVQHCNWVQALEGEIDSSHAPILHGRTDGGGARGRTAWDEDLDPTFEVRDTPHGVTIAARRDAKGANYWRINQFVMPFFTLVPPTSPYPDLSGHAWVPIDDVTTLAVMFSYHPTEPLHEKVLKVFREGARERETGHLSDACRLSGPDAEAKPFGRYWPLLGAGNDYGYRPALEASYFSAVPGLWTQDAMCQEGMGPIVDRQNEHLGSSDAGIIRMRRTLLDAATTLREQGVRPLSAEDPGVCAVRAASPTLPADVHWEEGASKHLVASGGFDYDIL